MIAPRTPEARSPGPRGPARFSPTGGSRRRAALTDADMRPSCHWISSLTASSLSGAASPTALAAYAAAPRACAPIWGTAAACPAARAAATAWGAITSRAAAAPTKRRRISPAMPSSPRANARVRAIASRGRLSPGASASNKPSTRSAQSAAHTATIRRSASLKVWGEGIPAFLRALRGFNPARESAFRNAGPGVSPPPRDTEAWPRSRHSRQHTSRALCVFARRRAGLPGRQRMSRQHSRPQASSL